MRRRLKVLGIAALASAAVGLGLDSYLRDGIDGWFSAKLAVGEKIPSTPAGTLDGGFRAIRSGVSKEEVLGILGLLLKVWSDDSEGLEIWGLHFDSI